MTLGAIDGYLEQLADELVRMGLRQRRIARILAEVRDHLEESARRLRAQGRTADVAQREAVARFGSPAALARSYLDALAEGAALANGAVFSPDTLAATSRPVGRAVTATRRGKGGKGMQVVEYRPELLPALRRLANQHLASVPPGWELTERQLATVLRDPDQEGTYFREEPDHGTTETFCVMGQGQLVAAASLWRSDRNDPRWTNGQYVQKYRDSGQANWILADPQSEKGLQILLETFAQRARRLGCDSLSAGGGLHVCRHSMPASWPHLITGLQDFGFEVEQHGILMYRSLQDADPGEPPAIDGLTFEWQLDPEAPEWELHALLDGKRIGECGVWGLSRHVADRPDYRHWINFEWTEVAEPYQRQGIGSWLVREQLRRHRERGAKHALRREWFYHREELGFYAALGFERLQEWWSYRMEGL